MRPIIDKVQRVIISQPITKVRIKAKATLKTAK